MKKLLPRIFFLFIMSFSAEAQNTSQDSLTAPQRPRSGNDSGALDENSLYSFKLLPYDPKNNQGKSSRKSQHRIMGPSDADMQLITYYESFGKSILDFYTEAYPGFTKNRFVYGDDLSYLASQEPEYLYTIMFKASDKLGDFNALLVKQLNTAFGLKTSEVEHEAAYYELTAIKPREGEITVVDSTTAPFESQMTSFSYKGFHVKMMGSAEEIAHLIGNHLKFIQSEKYYNDPDKDKSYPVITHLDGSFKINLDIDYDSKDLDAWAEQLSEKGLILEKKKGKIPYIRIEKDL